MLTVFTPIYNRANIVGKLYESLCRQENKDFEWLVVNDGSTDDIDAVMAQFIKEDKIRIRYFSQPNGGKHRAINHALQEARGDLFFIVDSDDFVVDGAVEWILKEGEKIEGDDELIGLAGTKIFENGLKIGGESDFGVVVTSSIDIRHKYKVKGDLAEVFKTKLLAQFPFPDIPGERFCSEGLVWGRIASAGYKIRYCYHPLIVCEYRTDGLSNACVKNRRNNPEYSMLLYSESAKNLMNPLKRRLKGALFYWRYSEKSKKSFIEKAKAIPWFFIPLAPLGAIIRKLPR